MSRVHERLTACARWRMGKMATDRKVSTPPAANTMDLASFNRPDPPFRYLFRVQQYYFFTHNPAGNAASGQNYPPAAGPTAGPSAAAPTGA